MSKGTSLLSTFYLLTIVLLLVGCDNILGDKTSVASRRSSLPTHQTFVEDRGSQEIAIEKNNHSAVKILELRCLVCHQGQGASDWGIKIGATSAQWLSDTPLGLIVAGDPAASRLVTSMIHDSKSGNMPPGATAESFPREEYEIIVKWVKGLRTSVIGKESAEPTAIEIIDGHCMNCHNGASATGWNIATGASDFEWTTTTPKGLIIPGNPEESRLVKFMIYSPNGTMPEGATTKSFPKKYYDTIVDWISDLAPQDEELIELTSGEDVFVDAAKLRLGDRNYVADVFQDIFGDSGEVQAIRGLLLPFGGPCPVLSGWTKGHYGSECIRISSPIVLDPGSMSFVPNANSSIDNVLSYDHVEAVDMATPSAPVVPTSTVVREGNRTLVCEELLFNQPYNDADVSGALLQAIQKIDAVKRGLDGVDPEVLDFSAYPLEATIPTDDELGVAHMLFFNFQEPSVEQLEALRTVAMRAALEDIQQVGDWPKRFEPWRYVLYSLCMAPTWQIP